MELIRWHLTVVATITDDFTNGYIRSVFHTFTDRFSTDLIRRHFATITNEFTDGYIRSVFQSLTDKFTDAK